MKVFSDVDIMNCSVYIQLLIKTSDSLVDENNYLKGYRGRSLLCRKNKSKNLNFSFVLFSQSNKKDN